MDQTKELMRRALKRTNAHGLARLVHEKRLYIRVLWLLAWLICCGAFLKQFVVLAARLGEGAVTTNFHASSAPFEYPDLYFCFDSPLSGSRHLVVNESAARTINETFERASERIETIYPMLTKKDAYYVWDNELAMISINSLPYRLLVDSLGQTMQQSILNASILQTGGMTYAYLPLNMSEFYHPSNMRCFRVALTDTQRSDLGCAGTSRYLYFLVMLDATDSRMGTTRLPSLPTPVGDLTAPYWALDKETFYWVGRWSAVRLFVTAPGHYPSTFDTTVQLEAGRSYNIQLKMSIHERKDDPNKCVQNSEPVKIVNPYDNSAYTVEYDYSFCNLRAVQDQLRHRLNVTAAFLPHPWPPPDRSLYNLSSEWGSIKDIKRFLANKEFLRLEESLKLCENQRTCVEKTYSASVSSVMWPSPDSLKGFLLDLDLPNDTALVGSPALLYLKRLMADPSAGSLVNEFVRANFLQLQLFVGRTTADRTVFIRSYRFENFVADVGGSLGVYLGMSVLTLCELVQFVHDLVRVWLGKDSGKKDSAEKDGKNQRNCPFTMANSHFHGSSEHFGQIEIVDMKVKF